MTTRQVSAARPRRLHAHAVRRAVVAAFALASGCASLSHAPDKSTHRVDIAVRGDGAPFYRIPALVMTTRGTLLAAYDARPTLRDLPSNIAIIARRSRDNGRTWEAPITVRRDSAPNGYGDPSLLVDRRTGRIFLFHAAGVRQGFPGSHIGINEQDPDILQADVSISDDDGRTWRHRRITSQVKPPQAAGFFAASGTSIQVEHGRYAGRLIQPYVARINGANYAVTAFSDDGGDTWHHGEPVGPGADENKIVELADGRLMLNSRASPHRWIAWSTDGGVTWDGWRDESQLVDPANNGAILRWSTGHLLFSNTEDAHDRRNLVVKGSCDDGAHWTSRLVVDAGPAAYSTIVRLPQKRIGILYERGEYQAITFVTMPVAPLLADCR